MKKIYIDTNIIVAYALGVEKEPYQYPKAEQIFKQIERGEFIGVISTLVLTELIGVLRTHIGRDRNKMINIPEKKQNTHVKNEAKAAYDEMFDVLLQMKNVKIEEGVSADFQSVLNDGFDLIRDSNGLQKFHKTCGICKRDYKNSNFKQILIADILHALVAKTTNCDELLTFDGGFKGIIGHEKIEPLQIIVK